MKTTQKTWLDLLGNDATNCFIDRDGKRWLLTRENPLGVTPMSSVLWTFESKRQAEECFAEWKRQIAAQPAVGPGGWILDTNE